MSGIVASCVEPLEVTYAKDLEESNGLTPGEQEMLQGGQVVVNCI